MSALATFVAALALYPASGMTGPQAPQPRVVPTISIGAGSTVARDIRDIRSEVKEGRQRGELSRRQAKQLRREAGEIRMLEDRYASGGLSLAERSELRSRVEVLKALARAKRLGTIN